MSSANIVRNEQEARLTDSATEVLHQDLGLFDFAREDLAADHRAEGDFGTQFLGDGEGERGFPGSGSPGEEEGPAGEAPRLNQRQNQAARLRKQNCESQFGANRAGKRAGRTSRAAR